MGKERPDREFNPSPLLVPWSRKSRAIPLLPLWAVRPVPSLCACTTVHFTFAYTSTPPMGRTACTEPQCLYNGALYLCLYLYSPYGPYGLYRASVPVQRCTLPFLPFITAIVQTAVCRSNTGIVGSDHIREVDVHLCFICLCIALCSGRHCRRPIPSPGKHIKCIKILNEEVPGHIGLWHNRGNEKWRFFITW